MYMRFIDLVIVTVALGCSNVAKALNPQEGMAEYKHVVRRSGDQGLTGHSLSVVQTEDGYLWVGTTSGLFRFDGVSFTEEEGAPTDLVTVYRSADDSLWFSGFRAAHKGLVRLKDRRAETIDPDARVRAIAEDEKGTIWYSKADMQTGKQEICSWVHGCRRQQLMSNPSVIDVQFPLCTAIGVISGIAVHRARDSVPAPKAHSFVPPIGGWQERIDRGGRLAASVEFPVVRSDAFAWHVGI
jgi:hypothetical protein